VRVEVENIVSLEGRVVIVTGAARSLGAATASYLENLGATVTRSDIVEAPAVVKLDVRERDDWEAVVEETIDRHGRIDGLVNNAGLYFGRKPFWEERDEDFEAMLRVNVQGPWIGAKIVSQRMADGGGGSIVNLSSTSGLTGSLGYAGYGTTRWAVRGLTKFLASDLAKHQIRANSVHPGAIDNTGMLPPANTEEEHQARLRAHPLCRLGTTDDVAATIAFLLSGASSWVTGREFVVDGGSSLAASS
jgi:3alpha(or 20beta)-hydroxysteroid dehydrogenase